MKKIENRNLCRNYSYEIIENFDNNPIEVRVLQNFGVNRSVFENKVSYGFYNESSGLWVMVDGRKDKVR